MMESTIEGDKVAQQKPMRRVCTIHGIVILCLRVLLFACDFVEILVISNEGVSIF